MDHYRSVHTTGEYVLEDIGKLFYCPDAICNGTGEAPIIEGDVGGLPSFLTTQRCPHLMDEDQTPERV